MAAVLPLVVLGCGEDAGVTGDGETDAEVEVTPLPDFTVSIEASTLEDNTPLRATFTARSEGVELGELTLSWTVDGAAAGEGETLSWPFYRSGTSTVTLNAERFALGQVKAASASVTMKLAGCADLLFDRLTMDAPIEVPPGGALKVKVGRLVNEGDAIGHPFEVVLALSSDDKFDAGDRLLDGFEVPMMASGLATTSALDLTGKTFVVPADVAPGSYYVFAVADPAGTINECQEANNARVSSNNIEVDPEAGRLADLVLDELVVAPGTVVSQGEILNYSFRLRNIGEADAKTFRHAFWISDDPILDRENDRPIALASDENARVQSMPAGFSLGFFRSWTVPEDLPDGTWWVLGEVDATEQVAEADESNNSAVASNPFTMRHEVAQCYDMAVSGLTVSPLTTYWGGSVQVSVSITNGGSQATPADWLARLYLSLTPTLSPALAIPLGNFTMGVVGAGETRTFDLLVPIGSDLPVLPHYVAVVVDPTGAWVECSESNNAALFPEPVRINALAEVDVGVSGFVFHPDSVAAGGTVKVEYEVANAGTTAATTFQVGVVLSKDTTFSRAGIAAGDDIVIDRVTLPSLAAGDTRKLIRDVVVPTGLDHAVAAWNIAVMVDLDGFLSSDKVPANNLQIAADKLGVSGALGGCFEDSREEDDTRAQAGYLELGASAALSLPGLGSCGDADWFEVWVPTGESLYVDVDATPIVSAVGTPGELVVEIQDPNGVSVSKATLGPSYRARAWVAPQAGTYAVKVGPATARDRAAYDLDVRVAPLGEGVDLVPFDVVAAPASAYAGGRLSVTWKEIEAGAGVAAAHTSKVWLSRDRVRDASDVLLGEVAIGALGAGEIGTGALVAMLAPTLQPGTWYALVDVDAGQLVVERDEDNLVIGGPVNLDPLRVCNDDRFEPNDEARIATPLTEDQRVEGLVVCPGLDDYYAIDLAAGDSVELAIDYTYEAGKGRLALELWAPDGQGAVLTDAKNGSARVLLPYAWRAGRWVARVTNDATVAAQGPYTYRVQVDRGRGSVGLACTAERYEPNDALVGAAQIGCGSITGQLCNGDVDWYAIPGLAAKRLRVEATNAASQTLVQLFSGTSGSALATIYGAGAFEYTPAASGFFYIKVSPRLGVNTMTTFPYTLKVSGIDGADVAVRDLVAELTSLDRGEDVRVTFVVENQCTLEAAASEVTAWLSLDDRVDGGDLSLWSTLMAPLASGAQVGFGPKLNVPYSTAPGLYHLIVEADAGDVIAEANETDNALSVPMEIREPCLDDRFEPNDVRGQATAVPAGVQSGLGICAFDTDWFKVEVPAGKVVTVEIAFAQAVGDLDLRVYNPLVSESLPVAVSQSTDDDEQVVVQVPLATTLYVRVNGYGGTSAPYALTVRID